MLETCSECRQIKNKIIIHKSSSGRVLQQPLHCVSQSQCCVRKLTLVWFSLHLVCPAQLRPRSASGTITVWPEHWEQPRPAWPSRTAPHPWVPPRLSAFILTSTAFCDLCCFIDHWKLKSQSASIILNARLQVAPKGALVQLHLSGRVHETRWWKRALLF